MLKLLQYFRYALRFFLISILQISWLDATVLSCGSLSVVSLHGINSDGIPVIGISNQSAMLNISLYGECNCVKFIKPYLPLLTISHNLVTTYHDNTYYATYSPIYDNPGFYTANVYEAAGNGHQVVCTKTVYYDDNYVFNLASPKNNEVVLEYALGKDMRISFQINDGQAHDALNDIIHVVDDYFLLDMTFETFENFTFTMHLNNSGIMQSHVVNVLVHPDPVYGILMNPVHGSTQITGTVIMINNQTMEQRPTCSIRFNDTTLSSLESITTSPIQYHGNSSFYKFTVEPHFLPDLGMSFYYQVHCNGTAKIGYGYILRNSSQTGPIILGHYTIDIPLETKELVFNKQYGAKAYLNPLYAVRGSLSVVIPSVSYQEDLKINTYNNLGTLLVGLNRLYVQEEMLDFSVTHLNITVRVMEEPNYDIVDIPCDSVFQRNESNITAILKFRGDRIFFTILSSEKIGPFAIDNNVVVVYTVSPEILPDEYIFNACVSQYENSKDSCINECRFYVVPMSITTTSTMQSTTLQSTTVTTSTMESTTLQSTTINQATVEPSINTMSQPLLPTSTTDSTLPISDSTFISSTAASQNFDIFSSTLGFCDSSTNICEVNIHVNASDYAVCTLNIQGDILKAFDCNDGPLGTCSSRVNYVTHVSILDGGQAEVSLECSNINGDLKSKLLVVDLNTLPFVNMDFYDAKCVMNGMAKLVQLSFGNMKNINSDDVVVYEYNENDEVISSTLPNYVYANGVYDIQIDINGIQTYHEVCVTASNSVSYLLWCKYVLSLQITASSAKIFHIDKQISSTHQFDRLFDVLLAVSGSGPMGESFEVSWKVVMPNNNEITSYENPFSQKWDIDGQYDVSAIVVSPSSMTTEMNGVMYHLNTGINATVSVESTHKVNETATFLVNIYNYSPSACILLDFGDADFGKVYGLFGVDPNYQDQCDTYIDPSSTIIWQRYTSSENVLLSHIYQSPGIYKARFRAINAIHNQDEELSIFVTELDCYAPTVTLIGVDANDNPSISYTRSESFGIESVVVVDCTSAVFHTSWKILHGKGFNEEFKSEDMKLDGVTKLNVPKNTIPYGLIYICVVVQMTVNENIFTQKCGYLKITASPLTAIIKNGNEIIRGSDDIYTLDASNSVDPDIGSLDGVELYFLCRSMNDPPFNVSLHDIINELMFSSIPAKKPNVYRGCYGTGPGRLMSTDDKRKAILQSTHIKPNERLEITLYLWKQDEFGTKPRISMFKQFITFVEGNPPGVSLSDAGKESINYNTVHNVIAKCEQDCSGNLTWYWYLHQCESQDVNRCFLVSDQEFDAITSTKRNDMFYSVPSESYNASRWYKLVFRGYRGYTFGEASLIFYVNPPPKNGNCFVDKEVGEAFADLFTLKCQNFEDNELPLTYKYFINSKDSELIIHEGLRSEVTLRLPCGKSDTNFAYNISFTVFDRLGCAITIRKEVKVLLPENTDSLFKDMIGNSSSVNELAESGDVKQLTNTILIYSSLLNANSNELDKNANETNLTSLEIDALLQKKIEAMKVRESFIENLNKVTPQTVGEMNQLVGTLSTITENPFELTTDSQNQVMNQCEEFTKMLETTSEVGTEELTAASAGILSVIGDVSSVSASLSNVNKNSSKNNAILATSSGDANKLKEEAVDRISNTNKLIGKLQNVFLKKTIPGANLIKIDGKNIKIAVGLVMSSTEPQTFNVGDIGARMDMSMFGPDQIVSVKLKNFLENIYTYGDGEEKMSSQITGFKVGSAEGVDFNVSKSAVPILLTIKNNPTDRIANNKSMVVKETGEQWSFQLIRMSNNSLRMNLDLHNDSLSVTAYLRRNKRPSPEKYDYKWILPDNSSCYWRNETLHQNQPIDLLRDNPSEYDCDYEPTVIFLSDSEQLDGDYYLGLHYIPPPHLKEEDGEEKKKRRKRSTNDVDISKVDEDFCVVVLPPPPTPAPTDPPGEWKIQLPTPSNDSIEFSIDVSNAKCLYWDETNQSYLSDGCFVGPNTTPDKTECLCDHLTDFGGDLVVAPAPIDFDKVFAGLKNLGDNLGVLMVILTILLVYILLLVWAKKKDRLDKNQNCPIVIDCTKDGVQKHSYIATIVTGAGFGAGTSAKVYITLCGSRCDSKIIPLVSTDGRKAFEARSTTTFKIILPDSIGKLEYIRIFHDNSGRNPSWYLRNIVITETTTAKQYPFVYDSWLAVESNDGQIEALLPVANDKDLAGFHIVFASTAAKGILDGHIWFSIFSRPKSSPFTRVQRLSCCLALIYLTMVTNAMFFGVGDAGPKTLLRLGNMVINITGIIIGIEASLIVVPPSVLIIEIFRRLAPKKIKQKKVPADDMEQLENFEEKLEEEASKKKRKKPFMFPYQWKYLAYTIIVLASFGSALFTFFYSMMWGKKKSNLWLGSMFAGFFQSVFVIQPVKAALTAALFALILRSPIQQEHGNSDDDKEEEKNKEKTECEKEEDIDGDDDLITADEVPIIRPSDCMLERARKKKIKEKMTRQVIIDILTYFVFLLVVISLAYLEKDSNAYYFRKDLRNMFLEGSYVSKDLRRPFHGASNPGYFYVWVRDTMIPSIFVGPWYNDRLPKSLLYTENREDLLISIPRFRQQRVKKDSCDIHQAMKDISNHECYDAYSVAEEDTSHYGTGWQPLNETNRYRRDTSWIVEKSESMIGLRRYRRSTNNYKPMSLGKGTMHRRRQEQKLGSTSDAIFFVDPSALLPDGSVISCSDRWVHHTANELRGFPYFGKFSTYAGSGYTANLGYNEETAWTVIADLHAHNWIDRQTRAVFVEFTVYNANINLFATAFLYMEILPSGAGFPHCEFKIFNGYRYALNANIMNRLLELLFLLFVFYFTAREIKKVIKMRLSYLKSFFNLIEVALLPLYLMMFGLIILRWLSTARNIKQFKENPKDFVSFQYSASADEMLQGVIGIAVFLLNIKFLKFFQFSKSFYKVGLVMKSFFAPLVGFCVSFAIYFIMFASAAHLGFGANSENYHTFVRTVVTQFLHLLGATDFEESRNASYLFGPVYYVAYSTFVMFITFNVFMAIICGAIDEDFEDEFEKNLGDIQVVDYLLNTFKQMAGFEMTDDNNDVDEAFEDVTQDFEIMDRKMRNLEQNIDLMVRKLDEFESEPSSEDVLIERFLAPKEEHVYAWL